jgi:cysteine-rich repeat protein
MLEHLAMNGRRGAGESEPINGSQSRWRPRSFVLWVCVSLAIAGCGDNSRPADDDCVLAGSCQPSCGDGILEAGEQCDDGNLVSGDGCDSNCTRTHCGNGVVTRREVCDDGNAIDGDGCDSNCTVSACGNGVAAPDEACDDGNAIDGDGCDSDCTATGCGNGIPTAGEACDDGNATEGDGCDSNCTISACGNGVAAPGEACDDGNATNGDGCDNNCTATGCGNGVAAPGEACDDGNATEGDGCDSNCTVSACGNGVTAPDEACDDGNLISGDGCDGNCTPTSCGNGVATEGEACDDGNRRNADGCDNDCSVSLRAYIKASNTDAADQFGRSLAVSADGTTLAVAARGEASAATGIGGDQADNSAWGTGAVYVFRRSGSTWILQAYIKSSNPGAYDFFGESVALSADGSTLAVGAPGEDSAATGINGNQADNSASGAGAVYVFTRSGTAWSQQAYIKASNAGVSDQFGDSIALSADGLTLAVGAIGEASAATGIDGDQANNSAQWAGAVYVFGRSGTMWSQQAYIKASNTDPGDEFGTSIALSADGSMLAVGAPYENSAARGIDGDQADNSDDAAGAAYVFARSGTTWSQQSYVKAFFASSSFHFGQCVALANGGSTLAIGGLLPGLVYVYVRSGVSWSPEISLGPGNGFHVWSLALSGDGSTVVMGDWAWGTYYGTLYQYIRTGATWTKQAQLFAPNLDYDDWFSFGLGLSADGLTLASGAPLEDSAAIGIDGNQADNSAENSGAVYVFY